MVSGACGTYFINSCSEDIKPNLLTVVTYKFSTTITEKTSASSLVGMVMSPSVYF